MDIQEQRYRLVLKPNHPILSYNLQIKCHLVPISRVSSLDQRSVPLEESSMDSMSTGLLMSSRFLGKS